MRAADVGLSVGERVAFHRRRRGLTQLALADLVGRTPSWVEKIENGRAPLDRISVVRELARALETSFGDLVSDEVGRDMPRRNEATPVRELALSYHAVNPRFATWDGNIANVGPAELRRMANDVWCAYQDSRWGYVIMRLNQALPAAYLTAQHDDAHGTATRALAHLYHLAASVLVKLGDVDLARLCAERGDIAARDVGEPVTLLALQRGVAHTLLSAGLYEDAVAVVRDGVIDAPDLSSPAALSVTGTLMLVGATAAAHAGERAESMAFLRHAEQLASRLGRDDNRVWTSFGPTNVAIHRVTVAAELGDLHEAVELGSALDVAGMPRERRVRHQLEVARSLSRVGRCDDALSVLLDAERGAPEQVRRHPLTHQLMQALLRTTKTRPSVDLLALSRRLGHAA